MNDGKYQIYFKKYYRPFTRALSPKSQLKLRMQQKTELEQLCEIPQLPPHQKVHQDLSQSLPAVEARMKLDRLSGNPAPLTRGSDRLCRSRTVQMKLSKTMNTGGSQFSTKQIEVDMSQ